MGLELRQQLKLSQQLVMTPQLQQAIKLLQLSRLELVETVQQELLENPFLEETADTESVNVEEDTQAKTESQENEELVRNADWENYLGEFSSTSKQSQLRETEAFEDGLSFEARLSSKPSLESHLAWQIRLSPFTDKEMSICEVILGNLDSMGYLKASAQDVADMSHSTEEEVESVLTRFQRFDPIGVASRDPRECLMVQLEFYEYDDPVLISLVSDHLEDLEKRRYKPLARKFKISLEELKEYLGIIQTLDPMPGSNYSNSEPYYVSPDVYVYKYVDDFVIILNEDGLPSLQMNSFYLDHVEAKSTKDKEYFQDKMRSAMWLMKSLYQRQRTLYKVVKSIVGFQREFFEDGVAKLKPLILKEVAEDINMHESTVSRITTNKYVATPHGVFELKFFFNSALGMSDGSQVGSESVKAAIKKMISEENPKKPFSDEKIVEMLKESLEVNIARRTVAKYRSALAIPSSSKRKQIL